MNSKVSNQEKDGNNDIDRTGTCGTSSTLNFVAGTIAVIAAIVIGYIIYSLVL